MKIDLNKEYKCNGKRVIQLKIKLHNGIGEEVSYPVKGTVVLREHPFKATYRIWSIEGIADIVWGKGHNLEEVK